jgi:hypothetical protein
VSVIQREDRGGLEVAVVRSAGERQEFIELPHRLYRETPQWIPWFRRDMRLILERRHPFFEHSHGEFFLARRGGRAVARAAVLENTRYNAFQNCRCAHFYFFDAEEDAEAVTALFEALRAWARARSLDTLTGPFGFGSTTGNGILIKGYEHTAAMTMMAWNPPSYEKLLEGLGFTRFLELYSAHLDASTFRLPERVRALADKVLERGRFSILRFRNKAEIRKVAARIGEVYNVALAGDPSHVEGYPLSDAEIRQVTADIMTVIDPALVKLLGYDGEIVGFVFGFPDLSRALKRNDGRLGPAAILRLLLEFGRTRELIVNGAGILPRYQRLGGNALLYAALEESARARAFRSVDLVQVAENTSLMLRDMQTLGAEIWKVHRVYTMPL